MSIEKKKRIYNKLVRDGVPEEIAQSGDSCVHCVLEDEDEYRFALDEKLDEEIVDYQISKDISELSEVLEVIHAIVEARGMTFEELDEMRLKKREKRGGFNKRFLVKEIHE